MKARPLVARASFAATELTASQIDLVTGGDQMTEVGPGCGDNGTFTVDSTYRNNRPDTSGKCGDP